MITQLMCRTRYFDVWIVHKLDILVSQCTQICTFSLSTQSCLCISMSYYLDGRMLVILLLSSQSSYSLQSRCFIYGGRQHTNLKYETREEAYVHKSPNNPDPPQRDDPYPAMRVGLPTAPICTTSLICSIFTLLWYERNEFTSQPYQTHLLQDTSSSSSSTYLFRYPQYHYYCQYI